MPLSSMLCRAQELAQRDRAASATLENVRLVAERAADAWAREALLAEKLEIRKAEAEQKAQIRRDEARLSSDEHDRALSENPDRGMALA